MTAEEPKQASAFNIAERVKEVPPSGIRRFFELAEEADDVISLGVGEPDFSAPWAARDAAIHSLERGRTSYTSNRGKRELREAIASTVDQQYNLSYDSDEEIIVTTGVSEAVDVALRAIVEPGDTVAVPDPSYVSYQPEVTFAGGNPLPVSTRDDQFKLTRDALESAGAQDADALLMCYPNNPTGAIMTQADLEPIAEFAKEHDLLVLSDEIYADLTYTTDHVSIATLPGMRERTIVFNGFSKAYAMTGLRLGYAMGPADAIGAMNKIHQYSMLSAPTTAQYAAIEALRSCQDSVEEMLSHYDRRRRFVLSRLDELGIDCFEAEGAFYVFPEAPGGDAHGFAEDLLTEAGVAVVPGDVFGDDGTGHLRMSYATSLDELKTAFNRIEKFLANSEYQ
ncbi:aminotransferase class I/II-fold pyridoxal phosphate-dependent enzyme [Salinarchaeum sp. IM2453]|uniref:pyridoxal phosphate-dependent aminotransferase n=1 Tax=Salinarchaeum sp. IM2453 TaxID=2862870 RepID=UPI001C83BDFA|nr:aminotransferase class I/II-fold pyridoxal phosphate-dependent enzyme [Salinarchaeum sp. IM2453]QZA88702.1 aminotransferase class I/II-fold pyridoxal phosphate-dependent enzyme [Salinarchaeum sp. IM2453]